jgi:hypothetical protein
LAGAEIVVVDADGQQQQRWRISTDALALVAANNQAFNDLAALGDDNYLLIANEAGYHYDAQTGRLEELFCVLPGDMVDDGGIPVEVEQFNAAVAVAGDKIFAAPTFVEGQTVLEQSLRSYRLVDGTPTGSFDLTGSFEQLQGITTADTDIVGVTSDAWVRFPAAGGEASIEPLAIESPIVGIAMINSEAFVLSADGDIHVFEE